MPPGVATFDLAESMATADKELGLVGALEAYNLARNQLARRLSEARSLEERDGQWFMRVQGRREEVHPAHLEKLSPDALDSQRADLGESLGLLRAGHDALAGVTLTSVAGALLRHGSRLLEAATEERLSDPTWLSMHDQRFPAAAWREELARAGELARKPGLFRRRKPAGSMTISWTDVGDEIHLRRGDEVRALTTPQERAMFRVVAEQAPSSWSDLLSCVAAEPEGALPDVEAGERCQRRIHTRLEVWGMYWHVPGVNATPCWDPPA